ncbi:uncharacterized protein LOC132309063 [Cornus florida]|uniref:uncharacterized protein LOC132309063 n=1 Tax=Cornus florida TaxID=4283 RepID=UPI002897DA09|nr:uncharacterized protein LOC132309063 [Cornus florida]
MQIQDDPSLKWPSKLKSDPSRRRRDKYCKFHRDRGHITEDCIDLEDQIENLIRRGHLRRFMVGDDRRGTNLAQGRRDNYPPEQQPVGGIRVISGGYAGGEADAKGIQQPYDDPLVVSMVIANYTIRRILIDNGSSADIIFSHVFNQMMIGQERLRPMNSPLVGFSGDKVNSLGVVTLPVTARTSPKQVTFMVDFIVVDCPSAYNIILGRTALNSIRAITSTY